MNLNSALQLHVLITKLKQSEWFNLISAISLLINSSVSDLLSAKQNATELVKSLSFSFDHEAVAVVHVLEFCFASNALS